MVDFHVEAVENGFIITHSHSHKKRLFVDYAELLKWIASETKYHGETYCKTTLNSGEAGDE